MFIFNAYALFFFGVALAIFTAILDVRYAVKRKVVRAQTGERYFRYFAFLLGICVFHVVFISCFVFAS